MLFHMFGKVGTTIIKSALVIVKTKSTHEIINLIDVVRQHCPSMVQAGIDNFLQLFLIERELLVLGLTSN